MLFPEGKRYRMLAWMYMVPLLLFVIAKGRDYYLAATYPMLYAAGAAPARVAARFRGAYIANLDYRVAHGRWHRRGVDFAACAHQLAWFRVANKVNGDFREEIR